jgi:MYXO-CTERM domain-containing protein
MRLRYLPGVLLASFCLGLGGFGPTARAATITCCTTSSDATDAAALRLTLDFASNGSLLTLRATNTSAQFHVNQIYFNASDDVTGLALTSATHSAAGNVTRRWGVLRNRRAGGLGTFDFELDGGNGANRAWILDPGESLVFVFAARGPGPVAIDDLGVMGAEGVQVAAKFIGGPLDPESCDEDSAFGSIPEPGLLGLFALGLLAMARRGG